MQDVRLREEFLLALEGLYRRDGGKLWRALLLYSGDPEVASDAVAEAFAQAIRRGEAIRSPERWVWRTAFKIAAGELKNQGQSVSLDHEVEMNGAEEGLVELMACLRSLSNKQRSSLVLHDLAGYTHREIAHIIGSTPSAVSVHITRARGRLRRDLEDDRD